MPRDGSGTYTYPPGTPGIPDTTIESAKYNGYIADIQQDLNLPRPIIAGGTGANNATSARDNLDAEVAMKQVTNYDSQIWEAGSFYSYGSATSPPVAGHAFFGTCHILDQTTQQDIQLEAKDNTDTTIPGRTYVREKKSGVWGPWTVLPGSTTGQYVQIVGDMMTGDLTINKANPGLTLIKTADGQGAGLTGSKLGIGPRWSILLGDGVAETGGNFGSNFVVTRFNDAGTSIGQALQIGREDASVSLTGNLTITKSDPRLNMTFTGTTAAAITSTKSGGGLRWAVALGDAIAETGGNAGSNFAINRCSDAGSTIDTPLGINRASGGVSIPNGIGITATPGSLPGHGNTNTGIALWSDGLIIASRASNPGIFNMNADGLMFLFNHSGATKGSISITTTAVAYNTTSDERLKEDLKSFEAGNIIDDTMVYDFAWKATGERAYGVIAQQAVTVYDTPIHHDEKNDQWFVDYSKYVPVILQELKALRARVAELEVKLEIKPA